jgi:hypothetical protein
VRAIGRKEANALLALAAFEKLPKHLTVVPLSLFIILFKKALIFF